jgi:NAD+ kinase
MKVAIYGQAFQEEDAIYVSSFLEELKKIEASVYIEQDFRGLLAPSISDLPVGTFTQNKGLDASFELFVSFGGDGTMLRAVTYIGKMGIPIVGVNTGRLGFLSTFKKEDVRKVVTEFTAGNFRIQERSLVEVTLDLVR